MAENKRCDESRFKEEIARRMTQILSELESTHLQNADSMRLLVAVSGGPDSTALVIALAQLSQKMGWELSACHVNHGLRGLESDLDQEFVENLCADLAVQVSSFRLDYTAKTSQSEHAPENLLRELRYKCLIECARSQGIRIVVTGHTLDDQAETMLFRLFRGTSPSGLIGMESWRELVAGSGIFLVRPLLSQSKIDCQRFLAIEQIASSFDSSNEDTHYARNYIRTQLVPGIDEKFPGWKDRLERLRLIVAEQEDWISIETARLLPGLLDHDLAGEYIRRLVFQECHLALKRRVVVQMLQEKDIEPSFDRVEGVISMIGGNGDRALTLSPEWELRMTNEEKVHLLPIVEHDDEPSAFLASQEAIIRLPDEDSNSKTTIISWLDKSLRVSKSTESTAFAFPPSESLEILADLSQVSGVLKIRLRRPGDVIQPFGMDEVVRLKKYLHTHKRSPLFRYPIVLADDDGVLWVPGVGLSERLRCLNHPTHRLEFLSLTHSDESGWA